MRLRIACLAICGLISQGAEAGIVRGRLLAPGGASARAVAEAVIYVDPLPKKLLRKWSGRPFTTPMVQQDRRFAPRVLAVAAGSTVRFENHDRVYHNVFSVSPSKPFDIGKYPPAAADEVTFDRPGVVNLFCDIHPGMAGYVFVVPHRMFTRPEADGKFALPKLPAGSYTLLAWHPAFGRLTKHFEMPRRGDIDLQLRF